MGVLMFHLMFVFVWLVGQFGAGAPGAGSGDRVESSVVSRVPISGYTMSVRVAGAHAYVGYRGGLGIVDVSDPIHPSPVSVLDLGESFVHDTEIVGGVAYLAAGFNGLVVADVRDPAKPRVLGSCGDIGEVTSVEVVGDRVYTSGNTRGLLEFDATDPEDIRLVRRYAMELSAPDVEAEGGHLYVSDLRFGVSVFEHAENPKFSFVRQVSRTRTNEWARGLAVLGSTVYVADREFGVTVLDVRAPKWPVVVGALELDGFANDVEIVGTTLYVTGGDAGLHVVDVTDPARMRLERTIGLLDRAFDVEVVGRYGFVANGEAGLVVVDLAAN